MSHSIYHSVGYMIQSGLYSGDNVNVNSKGLLFKAFSYLRYVRLTFLETTARDSGQTDNQFNFGALSPYFSFNQATNSRCVSSTGCPFSNNNFIISDLPGS